MVREDVHMQMADGVLRENMEAEDEVLFGLQLLEHGFQALEIGEDVGVDGVGVLGGAGALVDEGGLALLEGVVRAGEHGFSVLHLGPEVVEMGAEFLEDEAVAKGSKGVDRVVDAGFGDDEGMAVALAFGAFLGEREWVLTTVVGGLVANDVGMIAFAEDEGGRVVLCVFLVSGLVSFCGMVQIGREVQRSRYQPWPMA